MNNAISRLGLAIILFVFLWKLDAITPVNEFGAYAFAFGVFIFVFFGDQGG